MWTSPFLWRNITPVRIRRLAPLAVVLAIAGCGPSADDLQKYLHDQHQYDQDYGVLNGASYSYDNNAVAIKTQTETEFTAGQKVCVWASEWLYEDGRDGSIKVLNREGDVLSQRRAAADVCSFG